MIKCLTCREEFSYGRKIYCCHSTYFGIIFTEKRKDYKWNCNSLMNIKVSKSIAKKDTSEITVIDSKKPINYNWNCEASLRFKNQKDLIERNYILIYE